MGIDLNGVTISRVTAHNAAFIRDNKIGPGSVVEIVRSGDVIPKIERVVKSTKAQMPEVPYEWVGAHIMLKSGTAEVEVRVLQIEHFFVTLGIERFKVATIQKFVDAGYDTIEKILNTTPKQFLSVPGGSKTLEQVREQMDEKLESVPLPRLMDASGLFGRGFGTTRLSAIVKQIPDILDYASASPSTIMRMISQLPGFQATTATAFAKGLPAFAKWLKRAKINYHVPTKRKASSAKMAGVSVLFTGFRDAEMEAKIEDAGGSIASSIGKATVLVAKDPNSTSGKAAAARQKGIPILSPQAFKSKYKL